MASISPENPPMVNRNRKASANSMGGSKLSEPFHMVAVQLNTFTPVGTAISMVESMKNSCPASGMPTVNMWCAQTMKDRKAMDAVAYTMASKPNKGLREKVGMISETMPKAGRIRMYTSG